MERLTEECPEYVKDWTKNEKILFLLLNDYIPEQGICADIVELTREQIPATIDAIVDVNGEGDYVLPSAAFAAGHKSIFIRNGVYREKNGLRVPYGCSMTGESSNNVMIYVG
jgi:hypothetical protein